jgi:hypothetical protein
LQSRKGRTERFVVERDEFPLCVRASASFVRGDRTRQLSTGDIATGEWAAVNRVIVTILLVAFVSSACGGDDDDIVRGTIARDSATTAETSSTTTTTVLERLEPFSVSVNSYVESWNRLPRAALQAGGQTYAELATTSRGPRCLGSEVATGIFLYLFPRR